MRLSVHAALAAGLMCSAASAASAAEIFVRNGDFEEGSFLPDGAAQAGHERSIPGWTDSAGSATAWWNPNSFHFSDEATHGHVGFATGNGLLPFAASTMLSQVVQGDVLQANTRYTLTVDVGNYFGTGANWDYRIGLISKLNQGGFVLGQAGRAGIAQGGFKTVTYVFETGKSGGGVGDSFAIGLSGFGEGAAFDNVKLDATPLAAVPEPATWAMMIGGFGLVGGAMRRKARAAVPARARARFR